MSSYAVLLSGITAWMIACAATLTAGGVPAPIAYGACLVVAVVAVASAEVPHE